MMAAAMVLPLLFLCSFVNLGSKMISLSLLFQLMRCHRGLTFFYEFWRNHAGDHVKVRIGRPCQCGDYELVDAQSHNVADGMIIFLKSKFGMV
jgi:hypothetical protein